LFEKKPAGFAEIGKINRVVKKLKKRKKKKEKMKGNVRVFNSWQQPLIA